jgi:hypothetical protein
LITATNVLWVVSADFSRNMSEVDLNEISDDGLGHPEKVEWCGDNALVLAWGGKVVVVGPGGNSLRYEMPSDSLESELMSSYDYSPSAMLVGEVDGLRIISSSTCDFLQKVPGMSISLLEEQDRN